MISALSFAFIWSMLCPWKLLTLLSIEFGCQEVSWGHWRKTNGFCCWKMSYIYQRTLHEACAFIPIWACGQGGKACCCWKSWQSHCSPRPDLSAAQQPAQFPAGAGEWWNPAPQLQLNPPANILLPLLAAECRVDGRSAHSPKMLLENNSQLGEGQKHLRILPSPYSPGSPLPPPYLKLFSFHKLLLIFPLPSWRCLCLGIGTQKGKETTFLRKEYLPKNTVEVGILPRTLLGELFSHIHPGAFNFSCRDFFHTLIQRDHYTSPGKQTAPRAVCVPVHPVSPGRCHLSHVQIMMFLGVFAALKHNPFKNVKTCKSLMTDVCFTHIISL